ncbi:hypothetical protein [Nostoc sp. FACHB-892]|nr:hypothetical protein [Nostoc sp. FACHB-892]
MQRKQKYLQSFHNLPISLGRNNLQRFQLVVGATATGDQAMLGLAGVM